MTTSIQTERLKLIPLTTAQLRLCLANPEQLGQELGLFVAVDVITARVQRAIGMKIAKMEQVDPDRHPWYTYWLLVIAAERCGAGLVGFKGYPDDRGEVEIGYGIAPAYQGRGYTTEAARALIDWAFESPDCVSVIAAEVDRTNVASIRILEKVGLTHYREKGDLQFWRISRLDPNEPDDLQNRVN